MDGAIFRNWSFFAVLLLALLMRIGFFVAVQPWDPVVQEHKILSVEGDSPGYHEYALRILEGRPLGDLGVLRTPAYPLTIAATYAVFGVKPWVILLLQIVASAITLALLYHLTYAWFNQKTALAAGVLYALEPHAILYASEFLTDTLFTTVFLGGLVVFLKALDTRSVKTFFGAGLLVGVATLIRPISQFLPVLFIILGFFILRRERAVALRGGVALLVAYFIAITPWLYRNYHEYGAAQLTSIGGDTLLMWTVPYVEAARTGKDISVVRQEFVELARLQGFDKMANPFEKSRIQTAVAADYIKQHPIEYAMGSIRGAFYSFLNLDTQGYASLLGLQSTPLPNDWFAGSSLVSRVHMFVYTKTAGELAIGSFVMIFLAMTYFLLFVGVWVALRNRNYWPVLITGAMVAYFLAFIGPMGVARYKLPFVPLYLSIAGYGFSRIMSAYIASRRA